MTVSNIFKKLLFSRALTFENGKVEMLGLMGVIIPIDILCDFQNEMIKKIGENKTYEYIKFIGKRQGSTAIEHGIKYFGKLSEKFIELEIGLTEILGWGKFKIINADIKNATGKIQVESNFAKEYTKKFGKSKKPIDFFLTGLIEGFSESFSNRKIICKETKCIGTGNPYCEFIFEPKK
jgi:predicted hydrocarbon binding protein